MLERHHSVYTSEGKDSRTQQYSNLVSNVPLLVVRVERCTERIAALQRPVRQPGLARIETFESRRESLHEVAHQEVEVNIPLETRRRIVRSWANLLKLVLRRELLMRARRRIQIYARLIGHDGGMKQELSLFRRCGMEGLR